MKRLFWDIETSPNIMFGWRSGYKLSIPVENIIHERAIICICWKWEGQKVVRKLTWDDGDDLAMIKEFAPILAEADEAVAHNGDNFDMKWYNGRHLLHGLPPIPATKTVDTLKIARSKFYLNSNRLDYLATKLLGRGKIHTSFELWRQCMAITQPCADLRAKSVRKMVRYCKRDVAILELVWKHLEGYETPATHAAVVESGNPKDRWKCPRCGSEHVVTDKRRTTAAGMVRWSMKCKRCHRYYVVANAVYEWYKEVKRATERS